MKSKYRVLNVSAVAAMFRRVANDVFERTNGRQRPEYSDSLLSDYFLNPIESDSIAYGRIRDSNELADFQEFIRKFPASPFVRDAQIRIDLFERLRRVNEEEAKAESERIALGAAMKAHEEEAKKEAELIAQQKSDAARSEADKARLQAEKRAADERAKVAALEEEDRKKHEIELEKQHTAEICNADSAKLKQLTAALQSAAIQNLAKETACPAIKPAIENALKEVARGVKRACDADRKALASFKDDDIGSLKTALDHMTCETVRAEAQQRVAKLEDKIQRKQQICADDKTKLNAIDASAAGARHQYAKLQAQTACASLRTDLGDSIKKIDFRMKEAQTELARLGCYSASINGKFDGETKKSLALYHTKKGTLEDGDHLSDGLLFELKHQELGLCEPPSQPVVATPGNGAPASTSVPPKQNTEQAKRVEEACPNHNRPKAAPSGGRKEDPASRPSKPRIKSAAREAAPAPRSHQRPHLSNVTARPKPVIAHERPMPAVPTAESGSASRLGHIGGVGF